MKMVFQKYPSLMVESLSGRYNTWEDCTEIDCAAHLAFSFTMQSREDRKVAQKTCCSKCSLRVNSQQEIPARRSRNQQREEPRISRMGTDKSTFSTPQQVGSVQRYSNEIFIRDIRVIRGSFFPTSSGHTIQTFPSLRIFAVLCIFALKQSKSYTRKR